MYLQNLGKVELIMPQGDGLNTSSALYLESLRDSKCSQVQTLKRVDIHHLKINFRKIYNL